MRDDSPASLAVYLPRDPVPMAPRREGQGERRLKIKISGNRGFSRGIIVGMLKPKSVVPQGISLTRWTRDGLEIRCRTWSLGVDRI